MRRRPLFMAMMAAVAAAVCLLAAFLLLREGHGSLLVMADQPGAIVVLNGAQMPTPTGTLIRNLRADTYNVTVSKPGFIPQPASQIIQLKSGDSARLSFSLLPQPSAPVEVPRKIVSESPRKITSASPQEHPQQMPAAVKSEKTYAKIKIESAPIGKEPDRVTPKEISTPTGSLHITTQPDRGGVYVDDVFRGAGRVTLENLKLGEVVVRFGEISGYRSPAPQKVFLALDKPTVEVEGIYLPLIFIAASLDVSGRVSMQKATLETGYVMGDGQPHIDAVAGPEIKYLEETHTFVWEMGYAFTNRNPPGQDVIEMTFDLPERFDGVKPLELRLYGYGSDKRFPFVASARSSFDVIVNDRVARQDIAPVSQLGKSAAGFDAVPINSYLRPGKNSLRVQTSGSSRCYYYLYKIVLM